MQLIRTRSSLRQVLSADRRVALVPTMGSLHRGHLSLVSKARECAELVVTSIFVNPLQFAPHEDFDQYPRSMERDCDLLERAGCDVVFAPDEREMYPERQTVLVQPCPALADVLEGAVRPGFF